MPVARVFSQAPFPPTSEIEIITRGRAHFQAEVAFEVRQFQADGAHFRGIFRHAEGELPFAIAVRRASDGDYRDAELAEICGRAGGMSLLARRCASVWEIADVEERAPDWLFLALLASVLLGPILPADGSTLLGVRSARLRSEASREATSRQSLARSP